MQAERDGQSRSKYFIQKNIEKKKEEIENEDPYLAILRKNNQITIKNIDYYSSYEDEEY